LLAAAFLLIAIFTLVAPAERLQLGLYAVIEILVLVLVAAIIWRTIDAFRRSIETRWVLLAVAVSSALLLAYGTLPVDLPTALNPGVLLLLAMTVLIGIDVYRRAANELRESARRLASIQAVERTRIARDLHDDVAQNLGAVRLSLQLLQQRQPDPTLATAVEGLGASLDRVRGFAHMLGGVFARNKPFGALVRELTVRLAHQTNVAFELTLADQTDASVTGVMAEHLLPILQEAVGNAIHRGGARKISIDIAATDRTLTMSIADDGCGFDTQQRSNGLGLWAMRQRTELIGGTLTIDSRPGSGTAVVVTAPLRENDSQSHGGTAA
jgi:two-component system NarL family sensor kinase